MVSFFSPATELDVHEIAALSLASVAIGLLIVVVVVFSVITVFLCYKVFRLGKFIVDSKFCDLCFFF